MGTEAVAKPIEPQAQIRSVGQDFHMDGVLTSGITVVSISVICLIFGFLYIRNHPFGILGGDPTYNLAGWAVGLGFISFFTGLGLLIAGLVRYNSQQQSR